MNLEEFIKAIQGSSWRSEERIKREIKQLFGDKQEFTTDDFAEYFRFSKKTFQQRSSKSWERSHTAKHGASNLHGETI